MSEALHLQILRSLREDALERLYELQAKVGEGLEDREYQRHVGRIKECKVQLEVISAFLKRGGIDELDSREEKRQRENFGRASRRP